MPDSQITDPTTSEELGARARRLANLRPPWAPGQSGNPSGLAKDGGGTKDHPIRATLRKQLAKRRNLRRLVDAWIESAIGGDAQAREQILKRLDPVLDDPAQGRTILEGLRLELREGKASLTVVRGQGAKAILGPSDADSETSESRAGDLTAQASDLAVQASELTIQTSEVQDVPHEEKGSQGSPGSSSSGGSS